MNPSQPRENLNLCKTPHNRCHSYAPEVVLAVLDLQIMLFCTIHPYLVYLLYLGGCLLGPQSSDILSTLKSEQIEFSSEGEP